MAYSFVWLSITCLRSAPVVPACLSALSRPPPSRQRWPASRASFACPLRSCSALGRGGRLLLHLLRLPVGDLPLGVFLAQGVGFLHPEGEVFALAEGIGDLLIRQLVPLLLGVGFEV